MKRNRITWAMPIVALCLLAVGCSKNDDLKQPEQPLQPFTLHAAIGSGGIKTRASIDYGKTDETKETFYWEDKDQFASIAMDDKNQPITSAADNTLLHTFAIDNGYAGKKDANFTCETFHGVTAGTLFAFYPNDKFTKNGDAYAYTLEQQTQNGLNTDHLKSSMMMYANAAFTSSAKPSLEFKHLTAMLRFTVKNSKSTAVKITAIQVTASENKVFGTQGQITPNANGYDQPPGNITIKKSANVTLNITNVTLANNGEANGYLLTLPADPLSDQILTFALTVTDGNGTNSRTYTSLALAANRIINDPTNTDKATTWKAGKRYWFDLILDDTLTATLKEVTALPGWDLEEEL